MSENIHQDDAGQLPALLGTPSSLAIGMARAEIDQQITTARAYPRSVKQVLDRIYSLATLDEQSAEESMYALPRGKGADAKAITGPSIRFAEVVKQAYGNCRAAARVVHVDREEKYVEAEGVFHDLETNVATTARVRRRISTTQGYLYSDDMIIVTGNAACSIALRNAIMGGVPKPLWRKAFEAVQATIKGDATTLSQKRLDAVKAFANFGVKPEQVFAAIGVMGGEDITVEHIPILRGMFAALKNSEATVEEMFNQTAPGAGTSPPPLETGSAPKTSAAAAAASVEKKRAGRKAAATPSPASGEGARVAESPAAEEPGPEAPTPAQAASDALQGDDLPDALKEPQEQVTEAGGEGVDHEEQEAEAEPEAEAEDEAPEDLPADFQTFVDAIETVPTFVEIKQAMAAFFQTPTFKGMPLDQQNHVRYQTWMTLVDRKTEGTFTDLPDQATDVSAFRLWVEAQDDPDAINGTLAVLEQQPAFASKDEAFKGGIRKAAADRIEGLK